MRASRCGSRSKYGLLQQCPLYPFCVQSYHCKRTRTMRRQSKSSTLIFQATQESCTTGHSGSITVKPEGVLSTDPCWADKAVSRCVVAGKVLNVWRNKTVANVDRLNPSSKQRDNIKVRRTTRKTMELHRKLLPPKYPVSDDRNERETE